jgi:hypothetical protein
VLHCFSRIFTVSAVFQPEDDICILPKPRPLERGFKSKILDKNIAWFWIGTHAEYDKILGAK